MQGWVVPAHAMNTPGLAWERKITSWRGQRCVQCDSIAGRVNNWTILYGFKAYQTILSATDEGCCVHTYAFPDPIPWDGNKYFDMELTTMPSWHSLCRKGSSDPRGYQSCVPSQTHRCSYPWHFLPIQIEHKQTLKLQAARTFCVNWFFRFRYAVRCSSGTWVGICVPSKVSIHSPKYGANQLETCILEGTGASRVGSCTNVRYTSFDVKLQRMQWIHLRIRSTRAQGMVQDSLHKSISAALKPLL